MSYRLYNLQISKFPNFQICLIVFFSLLSFHYSLYCQTKPGKVEIIANPRIDQLLEKHKTLNEKINGIPGYRIQIFSESGTNSKTKAENEKDNFLQKFPGEAAYIIFQEPNYKLRIGDFRTKLDALGFLHKVSPVFPNAFIVNDKINFPKL